MTDKLFTKRLRDLTDEAIRESLAEISVEFEKRFGPAALTASTPVVEREAIAELGERIKEAALEIDHAREGGTAIQPLQSYLAYIVEGNLDTILTALSTPVAQGDERRMLLDLLATIHRDGGQHVDSVGIEQATADAISLAAERIAQGDEVRDALEGLRVIVPYLDWTISSESPGHHPTMPSAVATFKTALATLTKGARDAG